MCIVNFPVIDPLATGLRIDELRKLKGVSIKELANEMGMANVTEIYHWRSGRRFPNIDNLIILASVFNTTLDDIVRTKK